MKGHRQRVTRFRPDRRSGRDLNHPPKRKGLRARIPAIVFQGELSLHSPSPMARPGVPEKRICQALCLPKQGHRGRGKHSRGLRPHGRILRFGSLFLISINIYCCREIFYDRPGKPTEGFRHDNGPAISGEPSLIQLRPDRGPRGRRSPAAASPKRFSAREAAGKPGRRSARDQFLSDFSERQSEAAESTTESAIAKPSPVIQ